MITIKVFALWLSFVLTMAGGPLTDTENIDGRAFTSYESKLFKELDAISEVEQWIYNPSNAPFKQSRHLMKRDRELRRRLTWIQYDKSYPGDQQRFIPAILSDHFF